MLISNQRVLIKSHIILNDFSFRKVSQYFDYPQYSHNCFINSCVLLIKCNGMQSWIINEEIKVNKKFNEQEYFIKSSFYKIKKKKIVSFLGEIWLNCNDFHLHKV